MTAPSAERVRDLLDYDPATGVLTWRRSRGSVAAGKRAGTPSTKGYLVVRIDKVLQKAHRIAWLHATGEWPEGDIDHLNGDTSDNRLANLRVASRAANMHNLTTHRECRPTLGAYFVDGRWKSSIRAFNKVHRLGSFATQEEAHRAYLAARQRLHIVPTQQKAVADHA